MMLAFKDQHQVINQEINWFQGFQMMSSLRAEGEQLC